MNCIATRIGKEVELVFRTLDLFWLGVWRRSEMDMARKSLECLHEVNAACNQQARFQVTNLVH
jgi:hypothetical protein